MKLTGASPPDPLNYLPASAEGRHVAQYFGEIGLGDQTVFRVEVENAVADFSGECAVAIIDGVGMGQVNRQRGRAGGDEQIKAYGHALHTYTRTGTTDPNYFNIRGKNIAAAGSRPEDTAYHLSGDEFAVVLRGITAQSDLTEWQERIHEKLLLVGLDSYIGGALHVEGESATEIIHRADIRMQDEKLKRKYNKLDKAGRKFMKEFGSKALSLGIEPSDIPTLIEMLASQDQEESK